jgi:WD40 repeat protein
LAGTSLGWITLWDVASGEVLWSQRAIPPEDNRAYGHVRDVIFLHDGKRALSAGGDFRIRRWDLATAVQQGELGSHRNWVERMVLSPDGGAVLIGGNDASVRLLDVETGQDRWDVSGHRGKVLCLAVDREGRRAVSGGSGSTLRLWDPESGREQGLFRGHKRAVMAVAISPDGRRVASAGADKRTLVWDLERDAQVSEVAHPGVPRAVAWIDDDRVAIAVERQQPVVWSVGEDRVVATLRGATPSNSAARPGSPVALLVPCGPNGLASIGMDNSIRLWDLRQLDREPRTIPIDISDPGVQLYSPSASADGRILLALDRQGACHVVDIDTSEHTQWQAHTGAAYSVATAPDGAHAVTTGADGTVALWEVESGREIDRIDLRRGTHELPQAVAFWPDGRSFLVATTRGVVLRFALIARD